LRYVSGHDAQVFSDAMGALRPNGVTIVVVMGYGRRQVLAKELLDRGWNPATPAAIVADGTLPTQEVCRVSLKGLADGEASVTSDGPSLLVIGEVAALDFRTVFHADAVTSTETGSVSCARRSR
jgi:uroporphyrin-III C-methyltransferase